jgi:iron(III) transport system substrate-binding protein
MPRTTRRTSRTLTPLLHSRPLGAITAALLVGLVSTACSTSTSTGASGGNAPAILTVSGSDRQQQLEDAARKEGTLNWYTSLAGDSYQNISKAFTAKYPFLKINVFRGAQNDVVTRVKQELSAGQPSADALEVTSDGIELFDAQGQLADFTNTAAAQLPDTYKKTGANGTVRYATNRISYIGFGYNTQKVTGDLVPATLQDLANPALAKQTSVASSTTGVRWVGSVLHDLGDEQGTALLKQLGSEGLKVQAVSGAALMGLVGSGEVGASPSVFQSHASDLVKKGSPVKWIPVGSVVPNLGDVAILKNAKHPAAAVLMNDFLLGPEGQKILEGLGYASPLDKPDFKVWAPEEDYKTVADYQAAYKKWQDILNASFNA